MTGKNNLIISSPAFKNGEMIPSKYTCDSGDSVPNPPLEIFGVPDKAVSLVLIMDDPDIPKEVKQSRGIHVYDHWVVFNISPTTTKIEEGQEPLGILGKNSSGDLGYISPCPPAQYEPKEHRYFFKLYALDTNLDLKEGATKGEVVEAMEGHILAHAELVGRYVKI